MAEPIISKVVLYKHGIASFERNADVTDNQKIYLHFKQEEMNDVLKSLTVMDTSGNGTISSISYDNSKSIKQRQSESPFNMNLDNSILSIISELKGVEVSLEYENNKMSGVVVSTAEIQTNTGKLGYLTLWHNNSLNLLHLEKISNFTVNDPKIQFQLNEAMNIQRESKIKGQKTLSVFASGKGKRQVRMSYFIEAPIWKVSYRVIIPDNINDDDKDDDKNEKDSNPNFVLQGWAIIDNITEETWKDVNLTLISGEPHSCDVDLFNPIFKKSKKSDSAPSAPTQQYAQQQMYGQQQMLNQQMVMNAIPQQQMVRNRIPQNIIQPNVPTSVPNADSTETKELGDLFQYDIVHPVTVEGNQSALVPIVDKKVHGSRVVLYNHEKHGTHPNSAILLTNTTGLILEGGPCSVIESGTFVGESLLKTIQKNENRFIEYATEISMDIWKKDSSTTKFDSCYVFNTSINITEKYRYITTYNLRNKATKDVKVYIEHRFRKDCTLVDTPAPTNPKPITYCIFKTKASASSTDSFVVIEEKTSSRSESLEGISRHRLNSLIQLGVDKNITDVVDSYLSLKELSKTKQVQVNDLTSQIKVIYDNHSRIRSNLSTLVSQGSSAESLRKKYIAEMERDEVKLAKLEQSRKELQDEKNAIEEEASTMLKGLTKK